MKHTLDYKTKPKYSDYAKRHEKNFKNTTMLSKNEFEELSSKPCYYCGVSGPNGIDRINSDRGYEPSNCVPACKHCNYVKGNLSIEDFSIWTKRFVEHQGQNPVWEDRLLK